MAICEVSLYGEIYFAHTDLELIKSFILVRRAHLVRVVVDLEVMLGVLATWQENSPWIGRKTITGHTLQHY